MTPIQALVLPTAPPSPDAEVIPLNLPDHTQLPESDGNFVKNFQEHPQSIVLTSSIAPVLEKLHPDGNYCIGQDSGIYWQLTEPPEKGAEAPDWFYVPNVTPLLDGEYRRSYVLWKEVVAPLIAIEFVSGNGAEERDASPPLNYAENNPRNNLENGEINLKTGKKKQAGKFWVYEQAIRIPFYAIYEVKKAAVEVYELVAGKYQKMEPNERGHFAIAPMGVELGILYGQEQTPIAWLRWWDADGNLLLTGDEGVVLERTSRLSAEAIAQQERLIAQQERVAKQEAEEIAIQERQQKEKLAAYLRSLGINPDDI
jgi:Uma2 family endonuclease